MNNESLVKTGIIGAVIAALCCATPVLVERNAASITPKAILIEDPARMIGQI